MQNQCLPPKQNFISRIRNFKYDNKLSALCYKQISARNHKSVTAEKLSFCCSLTHILRIVFCNLCFTEQKYKILGMQCTSEITVNLRGTFCALMHTVQSSKREQK